MANEAVETIVENVHRVLHLHGRECLIEELIALCPELTWGQVVLAVNHLSHTGQIQLKRDRARGCTVKALPHSLFRRDPAPIVA